MAIQHRDPYGVALLALLTNILTLGIVPIYFYYWSYKAFQEVDEQHQKENHAVYLGLAIVAMLSNFIIPVLGWIVAVSLLLVYFHKELENLKNIAATKHLETPTIVTVLAYYVSGIILIALVQFVAFITFLAMVISGALSSDPGGMAGGVLGVIGLTGVIMLATLAYLLGLYLMHAPMIKIQKVINKIRDDDLPQVL